MLVTLQRERDPIFDHISMTTFLVHTNMAVKKSEEIHLSFCLFDILKIKLYLINIASSILKTLESI